MTKIDFSQIVESYDPYARTASYTLPFRGSPTLTVKHTGRLNKPYNAALSKFNMTSSIRKQVQSGNIDNDAILDHKDKGDRILLPKYAVVGWSGIKESGGEEVPFSVEACREFFAQLPEWIVDRISSFASNPKNFIDEDDELDQPIDFDDVEEVAKN